jgi:hypothetical protein
MCHKNSLFCSLFVDFGAVLSRLCEPFGWRLGCFAGAFVPQFLLAQLTSASGLVIAPLVFVRPRL